MVKGSPNRAAAVDFLRHATTAEAQAEQARWIPYGPMRRSALDIIARTNRGFTTAAMSCPTCQTGRRSSHRTVLADPDWWSANVERIAPRYAQWMAATDPGN